jgi:hypothetical protein
MQSSTLMGKLLRSIVRSRASVQSRTDAALAPSDRPMTTTKWHRKKKKNRNHHHPMKIWTEDDPVNLESFPLPLRVDGSPKYRTTTEKINGAFAKNITSTTFVDYHAYEKEEDFGPCAHTTTSRSLVFRTTHWTNSELILAEAPVWTWCRHPIPRYYGREDTEHDRYLRTIIIASEKARADCHNRPFPRLFSPSPRKTPPNSCRRVLPAVLMDCKGPFFLVSPESASDIPRRGDQLERAGSAVPAM